MAKVIQSGGGNSRFRFEKDIYSHGTDGWMYSSTDSLEILAGEVEAHGRAPSGCLVLSHLFTVGGVEQQHQSRSEAVVRLEGTHS